MSCKKILFMFFMMICCVNCGKTQAMKYVSSKIVRMNKTIASDSLILFRLDILTLGISNPLSMTQLVVSGKKNKRDASGAIKIFYTGRDSAFSSSRFFGLIPNVKGNHRVSGDQILNEGMNHFWFVGGTDVTGGSIGITSFELGLPVYKQVWSDEFNADTINTNNWGFENGFTRNHELQWYQKENATLSNGILTIEARKEKRPNPNYTAGSSDWRRSREFVEYTSASMRTAGKHSWLYGRFEMKARIDTASGYWPAWWTLGVTKRWPSNGEIDIMEYYRGRLLANYAVGTSRASTAFWFSNTKPVSSFGKGWNEKYHVWRMDWDEISVSIYVDDVLLNYQPQSNLYNRDSTGFYPFKQEHYMLLNLAIGGDNGGDPERSSFPLKYEVDYVRVSQKIKGQYTSIKKYQPMKAR